MSWMIALLAAAGESHDAPPLLDIDLTILVQVGLFLLLFVALRGLVFLPYLALRRERHESIEGARESAAQLQQRAKLRLEDLERQLRVARKEAAAERAEAREVTLRNAQRFLINARAQADEILLTSRMRISSSVPATELALRTRADELGQMIAAKVLGRSL